MHLRKLAIKNLGPLNTLELELPQPINDLFRPVVFVGSNGSGKTNLLSLIADALFECAAQFYQNVTPGQNGAVRPWFRVVGSTTITLGSLYSFAVLQFEHEGKRYNYYQKAGEIPFAEASNDIPEDMRENVSWADTGNVKQMSVPSEEARRIFETGTLVYFPSARYETPDWLNTNSIPRTEFDLAARFSNNLNKPIYVDRGLARIKQWLLALLIDTRVDVVGIAQSLPPQQADPVLHREFQIALFHRSSLVMINRILSIILDVPDAQIGWAGRNHTGKLNVVSGGRIIVPSLDALSTGQATLLNMFGTLILDRDQSGGTSPGICVVDEIDAHMHVDLQHRALPKLMRLFPHIQFIVSSHSPLFLLGVSKEYNDNNSALIIDLPNGMPLDPEAYSEFGHALDVLKETAAFGKAVAETVKGEGPLLVLLEGETDPHYFNAALKALDRDDLVQKVEFQWIGATDPKSGQGFHTGKSALDQTRNLIRSKPELLNRRVLLLYDNDANKQPEDADNFWTRTIPGNPSNNVVKKGIENLLPEQVFTEEMYSQNVKDPGNGTVTTVRSLDKMKLCEAMCANPERGNFAEFDGVLAMITEIAG